MDPIHSKHTLKLDVQVMYRPDFAHIDGNCIKFLRMKPNYFLAFVQILSMWSLQDILELMDAPRYLAPETQFNGKPLIVYFAQTVIRLLEKCIMEHLCGFNVIRQEITHDGS